MDILYALQSNPSELEVRVKIIYSSSPGPKTICIYGNWAKIYDFIQSKIGSSTAFTEPTLKTYFKEMSESGIITLLNPSPVKVQDLLMDQIFNLFYDIFQEILFSNFIN